MKKIHIASLLIFSMLTTQAQEAQTDQNKEAVSKNSGDTKFLLTGYGFSGFEMEGSENASFGKTGFRPVFLWMPSNKILFEAEIEMGFDDGKSSFMLEYANISYILNKYMTFRAGRFLSPFGTFSERLHPVWINKLATAPLGFGHSGVGPSSELGMELRGGIPLGSSKMNYAVYASNGPKLNTAGGHGAPEPEMGGKGPEESGMLEYNNFPDNNLNMAIGGRIGLLPFSNSSLELGFSFQNAKVGPDKDKGYVIKTSDTTSVTSTMNYGNIASQMWAIDFSYVKSISPLKGVIDIKGQLNNVTVDKADYYMDEDSAFYTFNNFSQTYYIQLAYRPALLKNNFLKNLELVGRYSSLIMAKDAEWGKEETQIAFGLNYWLSWRSVIRFNYQISDVVENIFSFQIATGF